MTTGNYSRAVECYYKSLSMQSTFNAAYRLARAYSYTGDAEKCVSALLYCVDNFPSRSEPYAQLMNIYPDEASRPEAVRTAIETAQQVFGM